jgi:glycosyltransferase involved in cell wall biosynthesis
MKILMVLSNFPDHTNQVSGVFYKRLVDILVKRGIGVTVIAPRSLFYCFRSKVSEEEASEGYVDNQNEKPIVYRPYYFPLPSMFSLRVKTRILYASISRCIKKNNLEFDLIDSRYAYPWCYLGMKLSERYSRPAFSTFIGSDINTDIFKSRLVFQRVKEVVNHSKVITVSTELKEIVESIYGKSNVDVIYDGLRMDRYKDSVNNSRIENDFYIGFVGNLTKDKGCDILLETIEKLKVRVNWLIVGDGPYFSSFKRFRNVVLTGKVPPVEVENYYKRMNLVCFPSKGEGIPNTLKEASLFQVPIIASDLGGIREMTDDGKLAILVKDFNNCNGFIEAITSCYDKVSDLSTMANALKKFVTEKFDIDTNADKLIRIYQEELLNDRIEKL